MVSDKAQQVTAMTTQETRNRFVRPDAVPKKSATVYDVNATAQLPNCISKKKNKNASRVAGGFFRGFPRVSSPEQRWCANAAFARS